MMTVEDYNGLEGLHCPYCESTNISAFRIDQDDNIIYRDHRCNVCKKGWTEYFTVTEIVGWTE